MVLISCSGKFHAFALAEQLEKHGLLDELYTSYAYQKNTFLRRFVRREDREIIPVHKIQTNALLAFPLKLMPGSPYKWMDIYDHWVASKIDKTKSKIFIGWSGMSLHSIRESKKNGKITIVERGSSHILYQNRILLEEYRKFGIRFSIDKRIIEKELKEYKEADYISIPSLFVKNSFLREGISESKLILNAYGAGNHFRKQIDLPTSERPFRIVYMGTLSIRKGLLYLFEALKQLSIPLSEYEVWFLGSIDKHLKPIAKKYQQENWRFFGHIEHFQLNQYLLQCDVGVQPSLEEGLSMVIPQLMACGIPVIVTPNSGGENIVSHDKNGFLVPIRDSRAIAEKIGMLFSDRQKLDKMKVMASETIEGGFTWDDYGNRYSEFINKLI